MAFEVKAGSKVTIEDILEIFAVTPGFIKTSVTDSMPIYFVNATGGFDIETETIKGPGDEDMGTGQGLHKITFKIHSDAADMTIIANLFLLAAGIAGQDAAMKDLNGMVHLFCKNKNGEFFNFWQKPDLQDFVTTPACSCCFDLKGTKFTNNKSGRFIEYTFNGALTDAQMQYVTAQTAAYVTTGTGLTSGVTLGMAIPTSSRALRVLNWGFHTCTVGGTDIGILDDAGFELEIIGGDLQNNYSRTLQGKVTQFAESRQGSLVQQGAASTATLTDTTLVLKSRAGETITTTNARVKMKTHAMGRNKAFIRIEHTSTLPFAQFDVSSLPALGIACNAA